MCADVFMGFLLPGAGMVLLFWFFVGVLFSVFNWIIHFIQDSPQKDNQFLKFIEDGWISFYLSLTLLLPVIGYTVFWNVFPAIVISSVIGSLIAILFLARLLVRVSKKLNLHAQNNSIHSRREV